MTGLTWGEACAYDRGRSVEGWNGGWGESVEELLTLGGEATQRCARIRDHPSDVEAAQRKVEHMQGLGEVGVKLEEFA
ncbi:MAG TPA: hypothetical protein VEJ23_02535 [Solirubrobacteraceae bacterium]|nr:hypothetical protein [Solirubrobacteraceae bacterium]